MPASDYKTALVTGASTGMGRAIAERLAEKGLKVHAVARNAKSLEELAATNGNIVTHVLDVSDTEAVTKMVSGLDIDVLVNCAGVSRPGSILQSDAFDIDEAGTLRRHFVLVAVLCEEASGVPLAGDDALEAAWFPLARLEEAGLALSLDVAKVARMAADLARQSRPAPP